MEAEFEEIDSNDNWHPVFQEIKSISSRNDYTIIDARKIENKHLNRYSDVTPYDHSRVKLTRGDGDYINANRIEVDYADRAYILTQGPLDSTVSHFWTMIWEQDVSTIIMLNCLIELGSIKCSKYWPDEDKLKLTFKRIDLEVSFKKEDKFPNYILRQFELTDLITKESRVVTQYHYISWPDFGIPDSPCSFLSFLFKIRESGALNNCKYSPPVIHCSAGIGRSGTLCLVDTCLALYEKNPKETHTIREILLDMRKYRMGLIQTSDQLRFSYLAILEGINQLKNGLVSLKENGSSLTEKDDKEKDSASPLLPPRNKRHHHGGENGESSTSDKKDDKDNDEEYELRKRKRSDMNQKMTKRIQTILETQKSLDKKRKIKNRVVKYGCISVLFIGVSLMFYRLDLSSMIKSSSPFHY